jgi:L-alanine-DL-glutamate epimerase-like enolase superfamily enzyme
MAELQPIRKVRAEAIAVPLTRAVYTPVGAFSHRYAVVASVETEETVGSYFAWTLSQQEAVILREMVIHVGAQLIGHDAGEIGRNLKRMQHGLRLTGRTGMGTFAVGVLDCCLWDIKGKQAGMPIWRLLGGTGAAPIPAYASGMYLSQPIDELRSDARKYREAKFSWVKMRVGNADLQEDLRRIDAVRTELGDGIQLMMDAVLSWDTRTALARIREYERFRPFWVEDPVDYREGSHLQALADVRAASPVRIAAGEFLFNPESFRDMIRLNAADFLMVDMQHVGGLSPWLDVLAMARVAGVAVVPHVFPEISLHVHCIDDSQLPIELVPWSLGLFSDAPEPVNGCLPAPSRPGLGFTFAWDRLVGWRIGATQSVPE